MEQNTKKIKNVKNRKFAAYAAILVALVLAVAVPLNLLASRLNIVWDMTPTGLYELSQTTTKYLDELDNSGKTVDFYFLMEMDYLSTDTNSMALYHTLEQYSSYDCINFVDFDPNNEPALIEKINPDGILNLKTGDMVIQCGENTRHVPGVNMYEYKYSYDSAGNPLVEEANFTGENFITGAIDAVVSGRNSMVYFLTGHGEKSLKDDYTVFRRNLINRNYTPAELNLSMSEAVPEDASLIIVAAPQIDLTNDETRKLNDYLDKGGNVSFLMSPNESDVVYKNFESIMEAFGIGMDYDIVAETNPDLYKGSPYLYQVSVVASESEYSTHLTDELINMTNSNIYPFMQDSRSFFRYSGAEDPTLQVEPLLQTISTTDEMGNTVSTAIGEPYGGKSTKTIENEVLDLVMYSTSPSRNDAKLLVFGNAEFIDDEHVEEDFMIVPVFMMLSTISWMHNSDLDTDMGIMNKAKDFDFMHLNSETEANTTTVIFIVVPFIVALIGAGVWLGRRYS